MSLPYGNDFVLTNGKITLNHESCSDDDDQWSTEEENNENDRMMHTRMNPNGTESLLKSLIRLMTPILLIYLMENFTNEVNNVQQAKKSAERIETQTGLAIVSGGLRRKITTRQKASKALRVTN